MKKIIVVDIETTGFLKAKGLIVEIGIVLLNLENGKITPIYNELVKEESFCDQHKNSWIFSNSNLTYEEVLNAKPLDIKTIQNILDEYHATAYNKEFDFSFFNSRGLIVKELPCPMILSTDVCKIPSKNGYGYKWPKVQEAWDFFFGKTDYVEEHRGLDDAKHEAKIVYELYKRGIFKVQNKIIED